MRVTNKMMSDQVFFNLSRSLDRFAQLQAMMSSGRRISKPSDDPIGTQKDLRYRNILSEIAQFKKNISSAGNLLSNYDTILGNMKDILSTANELAISLSNDTFDATARSGAANEAESLFEQLLALANSKIEGRYVFSGYRTDTTPFMANSAGVDYLGDAGLIAVEIETATKMGINLVGSDVLLRSMSVLGEDADLMVGVDANTLLADLNLGQGIDLAAGTFTVADNNLGINVTVDISTATTLGDVVNLVNNQLAAGGITNLTLDLGLEGNNLRWTTVDNGLISASTPLSNVDAGNGVDLSEGKIVIHDVTDTILVEIDLSSATSVGDVISTINSTLTANGINNVTASINAAGTGIDITDTNAVPLGLRVDDISASSSTASDLGIVGDINPVLSGQALNPLLDFSVSEAVVGQTTAADLGLLGDFSMAWVGDALTPIVTVDTPLALLNNGLGFGLGQIKISQGQGFINLDLGNSTYSTVGDLLDALNATGFDIVASINDAGTGVQVVSTSTTQSLKIEEVASGRTAHDLGIFGSPDILGSMMILVDALRNNDREVTGQIIGNLNDAMQELLNHRASVGAKVIRLETTDSRLTALDFNFTKMLSEVEDADLTKLISDLASQENSYQAALIASAKIMQPTLLDFLQ
ncbi:MAG: flagellar hook-associated protein FlgL [Candidatus Zixiibacteriota bacterium]|nr:MAG: flagellar hook-associated protein FlgL [candidate division Zixibacteria bacterium]